MGPDEVWGIAASLAEAAAHFADAYIDAVLQINPLALIDVEDAVDIGNLAVVALHQQAEEHGVLSVEQDDAEPTVSI